MKRLAYKSNDELGEALAAANRELAPTIYFCGKTVQCWFIGRYRESRKKDPFEVLPTITCAGCSVPFNSVVEVNKPQSPEGFDFHNFLTEHYPHVTFRKVARAKHKPGRPKDSAVAARGGAE